MVGEVALSGLMVRADNIRRFQLGSSTTLGRKLTKHALNLVACPWRLT